MNAQAKKYAYQCPACGRYIEAMREVSERDLPMACSNCTTSDMFYRNTAVLMYRRRVRSKED